MTAWRDRLAYVSQDPFLLHDSVRANLAWGTGSEASPVEVVDGWMHSRGHRENVLRDAFTHVPEIMRFGLKLAPGNLAEGISYDAPIWVLGLLLLTFALTCWQIRWGYFLALVFAMSLPWQLAVLRWRKLAWPVLLIALWPTWMEWDEQLFPSAQAQKQPSQLGQRSRRSRVHASAVWVRPQSWCLASS